jgi:hypothetical protein
MPRSRSEKSLTAKSAGTLRTAAATSVPLIAVGSKFARFWMLWYKMSSAELSTGSRSVTKTGSRSRAWALSASTTADGESTAQSNTRPAGTTCG